MAEPDPGRAVNHEHACTIMGGTSNVMCDILGRAPRAPARRHRVVWALGVYSSIALGTGDFFGAYPARRAQAFTVVLAAVFEKYPLRWWQLIGPTTVVTGVIMIGSGDAAYGAPVSESRPDPTPAGPGGRSGGRANGKLGPMSLTTARLTVRLDAVRENYRRILAELAGVPAGAAVKADGYGLGAVPVSQGLWAEGCREFFVASLAEGVELRAALPDVAINVFNGAVPGTEHDLLANDLVPLVISPAQLHGWRAEARRAGRTLPVGLHFDTGMNRTGIPATEAAAILDDPSALDGLEIRHVMSHLASADEPDSTQPEEQLARFVEVRERFPQGVASLANSGGIFRGAEFHFDLTRPGIAIYGGAPFPGHDNPMRQTVVLEAPILQLRDVEPGDRVGYGATYDVTDPGRHAVVPVGYADGYPRSTSNSGSVTIAGHRAPIVGRVSMDLTIVDVTAVPARHLALGAPIELIGDHNPVDDVARAAGTIANEILTDLGRRYDRVHGG